MGVLGTILEAIADWIFGTVAAAGEVLDPWIDIVITAIPQFYAPFVDIVVTATPALVTIVPLGGFAGAIIWFLMYTEA